MIKLPKEVSRIIKSLEEKGFATYCTCDCVRMSLVGEKPLDWDIVTIADFEDIRGIFDEAEVYDEEKGILRFDYVKLQISESMEDGGDAEDADEALIIDLIATQNIEEYLSKKDFTIDAIADSTSHGFIDPYEGKADISKKLVRTVKEPKTAFSEKPELMLKALAMVAQLDFDLPKSVYEAILDNCERLSVTEIGKIREPWIEMMGGKYTGKALKMLVTTGLIKFILGPAAGKLGGREVNDMEELAENVGNTLPVSERRIGLFYLCMGKKKALSAIEYMKYDEELKLHLVDAMNLMPTVFFLVTKEDLKDFLARYGYERYSYLHNLSKAQLLVYKGPSLKVEGRNYNYKQIVENNEPVYIEDLAINADDLIREGIASDEDSAKELLLKLTDVVHRDIGENTDVKLLAKAKYFKKHKLKASLSNIKWLR